MTEPLNAYYHLDSEPDHYWLISWRRFRTQLSTVIKQRILPSLFFAVWSNGRSNDLNWRECPKTGAQEYSQRLRWVCAALLPKPLPQQPNSFLRNPYLSPTSLNARLLIASKPLVYTITDTFWCIPRHTTKNWKLMYVLSEKWTAPNLHYVEFVLSWFLALRFKFKFKFKGWHTRLSPSGTGGKLVLLCHPLFSKLVTRANIWIMLRLVPRV